MSKLMKFDTRVEFENFIINNTGLPFEEALKASNNGVYDSVVLIKDTGKIYANNKLQDSNTSGDITISGGSSSGGSGTYAEVNHGTSDTTFTLTPNTFHIWDEVSALTLNLGNETSGIVNEFLFQFSSGETTTSLTLPDDIKWVNDAPPVIEPNMLYQVSILKKLASVLEFSNASSLVENKVTLSISGTKYLISLQYAAASNIVVKVRTSDGPISVSISSGEMSNSASPVGPMLDDSAYIELITPNVDTNYNYIW